MSDTPQIRLSSMHFHHQVTNTKRWNKCG